METHTAIEEKLAKARPGRPRIGEKRLPTRVMKLPESQVLWLKRGRNESASSRLRAIMQAVVEDPPDALPADPGPGRSVRNSYSVPDELIDELVKTIGERKMIAAVRRAIRADMAGLLS